jgi:hypothetical protein
MTDLVLDTGEVDLDLTLAPLAMLPGDPTLRLAPDGWTGPRSPPRAGRAHRDLGPPQAVARVRTTGPGAGWLAAQAPALLGLLDDASGFAPDRGRFATCGAVIGATA